MKNLKINQKKLISLILAFGISLSPISLGQTEDNNSKVIKVTGNHVNVRIEPSTENKDSIIGRVNKGDTFTLIKHENGWYLVDYYGEEAYIYDQYGMEMAISNEVNNDIEYGDVVVAKVTGNNINIRSSADKSSDKNIIGFADMTDYFTIIDKENDWYIVDYLGKTGYIHSDYVEEKTIDGENLETIKMVCLTCDSTLYSDTNNTSISTLPKGQHLSVIKEEKGFYKVRVDGVIGYVNPVDTKKLTNTFVVCDVGRQMVRVYKNNKEVYRAREISGKKSTQTDLGIFKIGHKLRDYQLTKTNFVRIWIQYNGNEGLHDASWQKHKYFIEVSRDAFTRWAEGKALTYPFKHGSHGCDNLELTDAEAIYLLVSVGDNVLVIGPNNLVKDKLIDITDIFNSDLAKCKPNQKTKKFIYL